VGDNVEINLASNSRSIIVGKTGSGKTHFAMRLLSPERVRRLVVFDTKENLVDDMALVPDTTRNWRQFIRGEDIRIQVKPPYTGTANFVEYYERVFARILYGADCIVYIDELYNVTQGGQQLPQNFTAVYTRGRQPKYGKRGQVVAGNIGVVAAVQRPMHMPQFCMTEAEHFFVFQLQSPDDRKRIADFSHPQLQNPIPDEHGFYYYETRSTEPIYIPEYKDE